MELNFEPRAGLPPLAWLARIQKNAETATIAHGPLVETRGSFFVEGIWDGPFSAGGFGRTACVFGSGGVSTRPGEIVLVSSGTSVDYLYHRDLPEQVLASNSLPLLLAQTKDALLDFDSRYVEINRSVIDGFERYIRQIPTKDGEVNRLIYRNLRVTAEGCELVDKEEVAPFHDFGEYKALLEEKVQALVKNARDPARARALALYSTQSTGYDSTAVNALLRRHRIEGAFTMKEAKDQVNFFIKRRASGYTDHGGEISERLGIEVKEIDRRFFETEPESEYLYWGGVHDCQTMNFHGVKPQLQPPAVLFTGMLGEVWFTTAATPWMRRVKTNPDLETYDLSNVGLTEARLHLGYVHAPLPFIGARYRRELARISDSEEMRPWSVRETYDRPIARRLAEEAGVPRVLFGVRKRATVVEFVPPYLPHGRVLAKEFKAHFARGRRWGRLELAYLYLCRSLNQLQVRLIYNVINEIKRRLPARGARPADAPATPDRARPSARARLRSLLKPRPVFLGSYMNAALYAFCVNKLAREHGANLQPPARAPVPGRGGMAGRTETA